MGGAVLGLPGWRARSVHLTTLLDTLVNYRFPCHLVAAVKADGESLCGKRQAGIPAPRRP